MAERAPPKKYNFSLNKSKFEDALHLRYGWEPPNTPHTCSCGQPFTLTHSLHFPKYGYTHLSHNEIRDTFATLLDEVCHAVEIEPKHRWKAKAFTKQPLLKMTLDLTSRQMDSGEADSAEPFSIKKCSTPMLNPVLKLYLTPTNIMSVRTLKYQQRILDVEQQHLYSTNFCVYRRSSAGLYKNRPETSRENKRKTERIILGHN